MYREIASGGMAAVHIGRLVGPVGFARTVAIKRLHPQFAKDPEFVAMFLDEARLVSRIRHPNVVQTLDVVSLEGELFLVMDFIHGESLARLSKATAALGTKVPVKIAASVMTSVLHGLHAAHEAKDASGHMLGIVHRDVSPHNIMVGTDGVARVLDFGVAYAAGRVGSTREGQIKGKIAYMSPEQLNGEIVDRLTDVYAASVVFWEMLAGRRLFDAENQGQILNRVLTGTIELPSKHNPQLPRAVEEVVMRGLARDPKDRWVSAREMAVAIERSAGVATPSMVGGWVESVQGDALAERAAQLAIIEHSTISEDELTPSHVAAARGLSLGAGGVHVPTPTASSSSSSSSPTSSSSPSTNTYPSQQSLQVSGGVELEMGRRSSQRALAGGRGASRTQVVLAILASCAVGVALGGFLLSGARGADPAKEGPRGVSAAAAAPPFATVVSGASTAAPRAPTTGTAATMTESPPPAAATSATGAVALAPPHVVAAAQAVKPAAGATAKPGASAKVVDCNPPFTFDSAGHKKYKLECL